MSLQPRLIARAAFAGLLAVAGAAQAALITIPTSALNSSPGVYTAGGYYSNDIGANIVTTGGGSGANVGAADGRNDDGYMALSLGFNVSFFGNTYNSLFINNNGNISFGSGLSSYIPSGPTGASSPVISAFFGDVDTRGTASGVVHYKLTADQLVVTYDRVGYFSGQTDKLDSFQIVLRGANAVIPAGEGAIGFFYETMGWDVTQTSTTAAVGFGDGAGNGEVIAGSNQPGMAAVMQNKYIWFDASLNVVPTDPNGVPEPTSLALVGLALAGAAAARRKARAA